MSKLVTLLCLVVATSAVFAQLEGSGDEGIRPRPEEQEGSGEGDVTRPRPQEETTKPPKRESSDCKCFVASGKKVYKLHQLVENVAEEVEMEYADTDEGCEDARTKCSNHCAGVGSSLFTSGFSTKLSGGRYRGFSLGNLLCFGAASEGSQTVTVTSRLRCGPAWKRRPETELMAAYTASAPLCCSKGARGLSTAVTCQSTYTDLGSGDDGVRPRPDEQIEGSGEGVRPRPDVQTPDEDEVEVTRPRPEEETTEPMTEQPTQEPTTADPPKTESTECKCFLASGKKTYMLHHLLRDVPEEVDIKHLDTAEGCEDARTKCANHCAGAGSKLFTAGYSAELSGGKYKRLSLGSLLCSDARSEEPITVEITSRLRCQAGGSKHQKIDKRARGGKGWGSWKHKQEEQERLSDYATAFKSSTPLCCARTEGWNFSSVTCPSA